MNTAQNPAPAPPAPLSKTAPRPSGRSWLARLLNAALWLVFCALSGTGLLLAFRLPPGSRGGRGLAAYGLTRHEWGDIHTWLSYAFIALIAAHLILHWRWFWQVAGRRRPLPLLAGFGAGLALAAAILLAPVTKNTPDSHGREGAGREGKGRRWEAFEGSGGGGWRGGRGPE